MLTTIGATTYAGVVSIYQTVRNAVDLYNFLYPIKKPLPLLNELNTGDIVLFKGKSILSKTLEYFGKSAYSHVGIILKNPKFLNEELDDGYYILESTFDGVPDSENHNIKVGVQIHDFENTLRESPENSVYIRKVHCKRDDKFYETFSEIHKKIHNTPYDLRLKDWCDALIDLDYPLTKITSENDTNQFWCSAMVSYVLNRLGIIDNLPFSIIAPRDFSELEKGRIKFNCMVDKEFLLY